MCVSKETAKNKKSFPTLSRAESRGKANLQFGEFLILCQGLQTVLFIPLLLLLLFLKQWNNKTLLRHFSFSSSFFLNTTTITSGDLHHHRGLTHTFLLYSIIHDTCVVKKHTSSFNCLLDNIRSIKIYITHGGDGPGNSSDKALGYGLDSPGFIPGVRGVEIFLHSFFADWSWRSIQPPIKWA